MSVFTRNSCTGRYCWERVLAMGILSVCLSIRPSILVSRPGTESSPGQIETLGFLLYDSLESLVSNEIFWCRWVRRFPSNKGIKQGYPLRNRNFATIGLSIVRTVADRHRLAAYHNKHCWRAFRGYQHQWPWMTLNPKNRGLTKFFAILGCSAHLESKFSLNLLEIDQDNLRTQLYWCCHASHEH